MKAPYDYLIVGADLFGAIFACRAHRLGKRCLVIDRRPHLGGTRGQEPFYTVNDERNNRLAEEYRQLATLQQHVIFGRRLAEYKYYDMAPLVEKVLDMNMEY